MALGRHCVYITTTLNQDLVHEAFVNVREMLPCLCSLYARLCARCVAPASRASTLQMELTPWCVLTFGSVGEAAGCSLKSEADCEK